MHCTFDRSHKNNKVSFGEVLGLKVNLGMGLTFVRRKGGYHKCFSLKI